jgi:hypothetical protein
VDKITITPVSVSQQVQAHMHKNIHTFAVVQNKKDRQNTNRNIYINTKKGIKGFITRISILVELYKDENGLHFKL